MVNHDFSTWFSLSQCTCCRDGGPGWALEVRQDLSFGTSVLVKTLNGVDPLPEGWVGEVFLGLFWLGVGEVEGFCFYSASLKSTTQVK